MTDSDLTLKVLVEMREELRALGEVRDEVRGLRADFNHRVERLEHHAAQTNQRLEVVEHTLVDFGTQVVILGGYMKNSVSRHDSDVERHDDEIADLRTRVEKLEVKD